MIIIDHFNIDHIGLYIRQMHPGSMSRNHGRHACHSNCDDKRIVVYVNEAVACSGQYMYGMPLELGLANRE